MGTRTEQRVYLYARVYNGPRCFQIKFEQYRNAIVKLIAVVEDSTYRRRRPTHAHFSAVAKNSSRFSDPPLPNGATCRPGGRSLARSFSEKIRQMVCF